MQNKRNILIKGLVLLATFGFAVFFPAWVIAALFLCALNALINKTVETHEKKFVLRVLLIAIFIKVFILIMYHCFWLLPGNPDLIGPDGEGVSKKGWYIARILSGDSSYRVPTNEYTFNRNNEQNFYETIDIYKGKLPSTIHPAGFGDLCYAYFAGFIYFLFGYVPLLVKGFNIFISAISSLIIYFLARDMYSKDTAKASLVLYTFFPTVFILSISFLREPLITLCVLLTLYSLTTMLKAINFKNFIFLIMALVTVLFVRKTFFFLLITVVSASFMIYSLKKSNLKIIILFIIALSILFMMIYNGTACAKMSHFSFDKIVTNYLQRNVDVYLRGGRLAYKIFPERYYEMYYKDDYGIKTFDVEKYNNSAKKITPAEFAAFLSKSIFFYFTRPFPFVNNTPVHTLISSCMIYWYAILVLSISGFFKAPRFLPSYPIFIYLIIIVFGTAMAETNAGTLLRHRESIVPFFIIGASMKIDRIIAIIKGKFTFLSKNKFA